VHPRSAQDLVADCPAAKELFDKAAGILGYDLLALCAEGPKEKLDSTVYSQVRRGLPWRAARARSAGTRAGACRAQGRGLLVRLGGWQT